VGQGVHGSARRSAASIAGQSSQLCSITRVRLRKVILGARPALPRRSIGVGPRSSSPYRQSARSGSRQWPRPSSQSCRCNQPWWIMARPRDGAERFSMWTAYYHPGDNPDKWVAPSVRDGPSGEVTGQYPERGFPLASSDPRALALMSHKRSAAPLPAAQAAAHTSQTGAGPHRAALTRCSIHGRRHSGPPPHRGSPPRCGDCAG
jgi:hypothetical protein